MLPSMKKIIVHYQNDTELFRHNSHLACISRSLEIREDADGYFFWNAPRASSIDTWKRNYELIKANPAVENNVIKTTVYLTGLFFLRPLLVALLPFLPNRSSPKLLSSHEMNVVLRGGKYSRVRNQPGKKLAKQWLLSTQAPLLNVRLNSWMISWK